MCRGVLDPHPKISHGGATHPRRSHRRSSAHALRCELCGSRPSFYCDADAAFLCAKCDRWVHQANFLARRHVRHVLCISCLGLTRLCLIGEHFLVVFPSGGSIEAERSR